MGGQLTHGVTSEEARYLGTLFLARQTIIIRSHQIGTRNKCALQNTLKTPLAKTLKFSNGRMWILSTGMPISRESINEYYVCEVSTVFFNSWILCDLSISVHNNHK